MEYYKGKKNFPHIFLVTVRVFLRDSFSIKHTRINFELNMKVHKVSIVVSIYIGIYVYILNRSSNHIITVYGYLILSIPLPFSWNRYEITITFFSVWLMETSGNFSAVEKIDMKGIFWKVIHKN